MSLDFVEVLVSNMEEFKQHESEVPSVGLCKDELIDYLTMRAAKNSEIMRENKKIIQENLIPFLQEPLGITTDEADGLFKLACQLCSMDKQLDLGLALEIHKALIVYAKANKDLPRTIRSQYYAGFVLHTIVSYIGRRALNTDFMEESIEIFLEAAAILDDYQGIEDKETRRYANRCLGNIYVATGMLRRQRLDAENVLARFFESIDKATAFWMREDIRAFDPDFPWDAFINNTHLNVISWLDVLRDQPVDERDHALASRVYESFMLLTQDNAPVDVNKYWPAMRPKYSSIATKYYIGQISSQELTDGLREMAQSADIHDYSINGQYAMLYIHTNLIGCLLDKEMHNVEDVEDEVEEISQRVLTYFKNTPNGADKSSLNAYLGQYMWAVGKAMSKYEYISPHEHVDLLLQFTTFGNLATYAHSLQVKNIVEILSEHFIYTQPSLFVGMLGTKDVKEVLANKEEILHMASRAALCHDINKVYFNEVLSLSSRSLFDYEFDIIKDHAQAHNLPQEGDALLGCILDVIRGHHRWYDGTSGYPSDFDNTISPNKFIIDMVSIADSIDAATDAVGRSHAKILTLKEIVDDINRYAGARYCPIISKILYSDGIFDKIQHCITAGRKDAYFTAYLDITQ